MAWNNRVAVLPVVFLQLFLSRAVLGQYGDRFIQPLPTGDPEGVQVDAANLQVFVNEGLDLPADDPITANIIAKLDYTGTDLPRVDRVVGQNAPVSPPTLSIVQLTDVVGWENGYYIKLETQLDYEGFSATWAVFLQPVPTSNPFFALLPVDINDEDPIFQDYPKTAIEITENEEPNHDGIATFEAVDADTVDAGKLRYSLEDLQGDGTPRFEIDPVSGKLYQTEKLDYESRVSHQLRISVTDSDNIHPVDAPVITVINVQDVNDQPPRWITVRYRLEVEENTPLGTPVENGIYKAIDQDLGINDKITYSLKPAPDNPDITQYLEIEPTLGTISVIGNIDAEADDFQQLSLDFIVVATEVNDLGFFIEETVSLRIIDLNDNPPLIGGQQSKEFEVTISESFVGELPDLDGFEVIDADVTLDFARYTAEILDSRAWLTDALEVSPETGSETTSFKILVKGENLIDYEDPNWRELIEFTVRITADSDATKTAEAKIKLTVQDANDNDPEFQNLDPNDGSILFTPLENVANGDLIGTISAIDADIIPEFGTPSIIYTWFKTIPKELDLNPTSGAVTVKKDNAFDYEQLNELVYYVEAVDNNNGPDSRRTTNILRISVQDVNDESPTIILPSREVEIDENDPDVIVAENILISDPDTDHELTIEITSSSSNGFDVSRWFKYEETQEPGNPIQIRILVGDETPDYEKAQRVDVAIKVVDLKTAPDFQDKRESISVLSVILINLNDEKPVIDKPINIRVTETQAECVDDVCSCVGEGCNDEAARFIYSFRASDADNLPNPLLFSVTSRIPAMIPLVTINENTGVLSRADGQIIDRDRSYDDDSDEDFTNDLFYTISVSDGDFTTDLEVTIRVEDINDEIPVWTFDNTGYEMSEGSEIGALVVKVAATDRDAGNFGTVKYFIDEDYNNGFGADMFAMDQDSGELTVKQKLDREEVPNGYTLQIQARDNYREGTTINSNIETDIIEIKLLDENDNKPEFSDHVFKNVNEDKAEPNTVLGTVMVKDADLGDNGKVEVEIVSVTCTKCNNNHDPMAHFLGDWDLSTHTYTITSIKSFHGWFGIFTIKLSAKDNATPPQVSGEAEYTLNVLDINDNPPVISFPDNDGITFYIKENLPVGQRLMEWDEEEFVRALTATDADDPDSDNGKFEFTLESLEDDPNDAASYFAVGMDDFLEVRKQLDIDLNPYTFTVVATDLTEPFHRDTKTLTIKVVPIINTPPVFSVNEQTISFIENNQDLTHEFGNATDADIVDDQNLFSETICYFIVHYGPAPEDFPFVLDQETNVLALSKPLDREEIDVYNFVVHAKNNVIGDCVPPSNPNIQSPSNIRVQVDVLDVKDTKPVWPPELGPVISGGVRTSAKQGSTTSVILRATDADLDETLTYTLGTTIDHSDPSLEPITNPFELGSGTDSNEIFIRFQPQPTMKGFFNFSVTVHDSAAEPMSAETQCKIYMINQDNTVIFTFNNLYTEFDDPEKRAELALVITRVFSNYESDYKCNIDETLEAVDSNGVQIQGKTRMETHFINSARSEPILKTVIENLQFDEPDLMTNLTLELRAIGFSLDLYTYLGDKENSDDVLTYILVAGVGVLAILLLIVSITCWFNNKSLSRRVRALTATTFGSNQSLDKVGTGLALPNTNQHAIQGSNPIYSKEAEAEGRPRGIPDFDTESVGSGGSVLIGVEDDDDFRNYEEMPARNDNFQFGGLPSSNSNPMFDGGDDDNFNYLETHSHDDSPDSDFGRQELPNANGNVTRRNPLMNMDSFDA